MSDIYGTNRLYKTIKLFCILRKTTIGAMCKQAGVSPGLVTDLKMGRKQSLQLETAAKLASALGISVSLLNENDIEVTRSVWDLDEFGKWSDCDTDSDRVYLLKELGFPESMAGNDEFLETTLRAIIRDDQKENPPAVSGEGKQKLRSVSRLESADISPEMDKSIADYIDFLLKKGDK